MSLAMVGSSVHHCQAAYDGSVRQMKNHRANATVRHDDLPFIHAPQIIDLACKNCTTEILLERQPRVFLLQLKN